MEMNVDNLSLWNSVEQTNPAHTKNFKRGGGFSGTAVSPMALIHRATELWGPMGGSWGVEVVSEQVLEGAPLVEDGIGVVGHEKIHTVRINLRHPGGNVPAVGQTTFVGVNKNGYFTDEEAPKKSLTDALSKALSWLGFSADIHMGKYDDNKYVNDLKEQFAGKPKVEPKKMLEKPITPTDGAGEGLTEEQKNACSEAALYMQDLFNDGRELDLLAYWKAPESFSSNDERVYVWKLLQSNSKLRSFLNANRTQQKEAA